ncbi:MAG: cation:dicarboxylase symporter family transporter, partial [Melioribacteraceae bacterium]|nr:cation:dicarboxylase symporter family transporter [Melioribacteraceae bacterium]
MKRIALHWQIIIGMIAGIVVGLIFANFSWGPQFIRDWVKPFGTIFINLLKLIAIPLIIASLMKGISDLKEISTFSRIGGRTIIVYICTTVLAITVGLILVNIIQPGEHMGEETLQRLTTAFQGDAQSSVETAQAQKDKGPLQFFIDIVPDNIFGAMSDNRNM